MQPKSSLICPLCSITKLPQFILNLCTSRRWEGFLPGVKSSVLGVPRVKGAVVPHPLLHHLLQLLPLSHGGKHPAHVTYRGLTPLLWTRGLSLDESLFASVFKYLVAVEDDLGRHCQIVAHLQMWLYCHLV